MTTQTRASDFGPPNVTSLQAEEAVIGAVLIDPDAFGNCSAYISAEDFHVHKNRWLWDAFTTLQGQSQNIDTLTVTDILEQRGQLAEVGGTAYFARLMVGTPTSQNAEDYARIIARESTRRRLMAVANEIARLATNTEREPDELVNEAAMAVSQVARARAGEVYSQTEAVDQFFGEIGEFANHGAIPGLTTGYPKVDAKTQGIKRGELLILAGRPSMGKTSLAAQMSIRQARAGLRVGVFTLEEKKQTWVSAAALAELGMNGLRASELDMERISDKCAELYKLPVAYYERGYSSMAEIEKHIRAMANLLGGLDMIWLDHLGYIRHDTGRHANLPYAIGQTTKRLAYIAKEYNAGVSALCQLSRESARTGQEPHLVDLRDSGEIEQDARQVWMIHTPGYYADNPPADDRMQESSLLVRKNSKGPTGKITLAFIKAYRRFAETI